MSPSRRKTTSLKKKLIEEELTPDADMQRTENRSRAEVDRSGSSRSQRVAAPAKPADYMIETVIE